jgi:Polyketide cyclase / dehydrase and lipid transport
METRSGQGPLTGPVILPFMDAPKYSDSVVVAASPEALYDMVSDVTRMGEWSPVCKACWWDEGDGPRAGAWFTGHNELPERTWETRSLVVAADRGREFTFQVRGSWARWGYAFEAVPEGTRLTESWEFLPDGIAGFHERYGDDADNQIAIRERLARSGVPATLAAIKAAAEAG